MTSGNPLVSIALALALTIAFPAPRAAAAPAPERSWPHYFAVKAVMQRLYDAERGTLWSQRLERDTPARERGGGAKYDVVNCLRGSAYTGTADHRRDVTAAFADVAFDIVIWRDGFRRLGYPAALWQSSLTDYEQRSVDRAIALPVLPEEDPPGAAIVDALVRRLNAYRATHLNLPAIIHDGGCGAGEALVSIATAPAGAQVLVIPTFFYELCKVQKQNADDPNACPRWREALEGKLQSVAGDYLYQARWPDGKTRRGTLRFDIGDAGKTITLRKP
jgi:hypothetical protein